MWPSTLVCLHSFYHSIQVIWYMYNAIHSISKDVKMLSKSVYNHWYNALTDLCTFFPWRWRITWLHYGNVGQQEKQRANDRGLGFIFGCKHCTVHRLVGILEKMCVIILLIVKRFLMKYKKQALTNISHILHKCLGFIPLLTGLWT